MKRYLTMRTLGASVRIPFHPDMEVKELIYSAIRKDDWFVQFDGHDLLRSVLSCALDRASQFLPHGTRYEVAVSEHIDDRIYGCEWIYSPCYLLDAWSSQTWRRHSERICVYQTEAGHPEDIDTVLHNFAISADPLHIQVVSDPRKLDLARQFIVVDTSRR